MTFRLNPVLKDFLERLFTAAAIGAVVAYQAGARDYKLLGYAGLGAAVSFVKNSTKVTINTAKAVPTPKATPAAPPA